MTTNLTDIFDQLSIEELDRIALVVSSIKKSKESCHNPQVSISEFRNDYLIMISNTFSSDYYRSLNLSFKHIMNYFGFDYCLRDIKVNELEKFKNHLMLKAPSGYKVYLRNLKAAFNRAVDWEIISSNPFAKIKISKSQQSKPIYLNFEDLGLLLNNTNSRTLRKMFAFPFYTGCRLGEIVKLKWKHVDLNRNLLTIGDDDLHTKNKRTRTIPICEILHSKLVKLGFSDDSDGYIFTKSNGFPFNRDYISRAFKKVVRKVSLSEKIHFHTLRHSFASNLAIKGVPLIVIKELLGHSSIVTTQIYSHSDLDSLKKAVGKFDEI